MRLRGLSSAMDLGLSATLNENKLKMPTEQRYLFVTLPRNVFEEISSAQKTGKPNAIPLDKRVFQISLGNFRDEDHPCPSGAGGDHWELQAGKWLQGWVLWTDPSGQGPKELVGAWEGAVPDWAGKKTSWVLLSQVQFLMPGLWWLWLQMTFWKQVITSWCEMMHLNPSPALRLIVIYFLMVVNEC